MTVIATSGEIELLNRGLPETLRLGDETGDPGIKLAVRSVQAYSLLSLGKIKETVEVVDEVMKDPPEHPKLGSELMGISPYIQMQFIRAFSLAYLGRTKEAMQGYEACVAMAEEHGEMEIAGWARGTPNLIAYLTGEIGVGLDAARKAFEIANKIGSMISLTTARWALGTAHVVLEEWE
jgi:hypothetical protein